MLNKVLVLLLVTTCSYATFVLMGELTIEKESQNVSNYFALEDETIFAINFPYASNPINETIETIPLNADLISSLAPSTPENCTIYFSKKRGIVVFESNYDWTQNTLRSLFINGKHQVKFTGNRKLTFGEYRGNYTENKLILRTPKIKNTKSSLFFEIDKKASRSRINIIDATVQVTDFYEKTNALISYADYPNINKEVKNTDDQAVFSKFIPSDFDSYTYYELNYLKETDTVFANNMFSNWIKTGLLVLKKADKHIFIMDMKDGQRALDNLSEKLGEQQTEANFRYLRNFILTSSFRKDFSKGMYVTDIQNFVILSEDKALFDALGAEIAMGNSLNKNQKKAERIYAGLPKKVLYRSYERNLTPFAISEAGKKWITTRYIDFSGAKEDEDDPSKSYFSMNPSEKINSFYAYSGRGNTFLITASNKWIRYANGVRKWEKTFDKEVISTPKLMEMSTDKNQDISILFKDEAWIVDTGGRILNRFPTSGGVHPIRFRLKRKISFLIPNVNTMTVTDNDGRTLSTYSFSSEIKDMVLFMEKNRKVVAVLCENKLFIIDLEQKRTIRKFELEGVYELLKFSAKSVVISQDRKHTVNLQGKQSSLQCPVGFEFKVAFENNGNLELLFANGNELLAINSNGQFVGKKSLDCSSIDKIQIYTRENRPIEIGVLDGIENKIVLLNSENLTEQGKKRHGEKSLQLTTYDRRGISITTFLGDKLIQYTKF